MGELRRATGDRRCWLPGRLLIGRSAVCLLRIRDRRVSGEHARLDWQGDGWEVRDLGSSNGTMVNDRRIEPGEGVRLVEGATICFGSSSERWVLTSAAPPEALAVVRGEERAVRAESGFLALPADQRPEVYIYPDEGGAWQAERGDEIRAVYDRELITAGGQQWVLHLPGALGATWSPRSAQVDTPGLRFVVSRDEEHVAVYLQRASGESRLPSRAYDYLLLTLARARLADRERGIPPAEAGWLYVDDICRMLRIDDNKLGVDIYRARKVFSVAGVPGAAGLIERRRTTRQVRIGIRRLVLGAP